jgi:hypothetical protein
VYSKANKEEGRVMNEGERISKERRERQRRENPGGFGRFGHRMGTQGGEMDEVISEFVDKHNRWPEVEDIHADLQVYTNKRIKQHLNHIQLHHRELVPSHLRGIFR